MARVLITGMSGTGKSTALRGLAARGHRTVDTDTGEWSRWVRLPDGWRPSSGNWKRSPGTRPARYDV